MANNFLNGKWQSVAQIQWAPTLFAHDPSPPISLEGSPDTIVPTSIASAEAFGTPTITANQTITATGIVSAEVFGNPVVTIGQTITVTSIPSEEVFGVPTMVFGQTLTITGIASAESFGVANFILIVPPVPPPPPPPAQPCQAFGIGLCVGVEGPSDRLRMTGRAGRRGSVVTVGYSGSADSIQSRNV